MKRIHSILIISAICHLAYGQQIAEIIEYTPAPGQFINTASGVPDAAETLTQEGGGLVSLGGFGGYIILKLASSIENDPNNPYGVDFTIFGNALSYWSEPGIVSVMKDENKNGIADETWYELAGSDHFFPTTISNYQISYTNPHSDEAVDIPWGDNQGVTGFLLRNIFQNQPYYPDPEIFSAIGDSKCEFEGTRIEPVLDFSNPAQGVSNSRRFGYADNNVRIDPDNPLPDDPYTRGSENSGGDGMDIAWAIDESGNYVGLDEIDFVKIYTAVNANGGILGEISTEISRLVDVTPTPGYPMTEKIITVKELPSKIIPEAYELEYAVFFQGKYKEDETVTWTVECLECWLENNDILLAEQEETLTLTATLDSDPSIFTSFTTEVDNAVEVDLLNNDRIYIYPNPASDFFIVNMQQVGIIELISSLGQIVYTGESSTGEINIDVHMLPAGIYFLRHHGKNGIGSNKIMIFR